MRYIRDINRPGEWGHMVIAWWMQKEVVVTVPKVITANMPVSPHWPKEYYLIEMIEGNSETHMYGPLPHEVMLELRDERFNAIADLNDIVAAEVIDNPFAFGPAMLAGFDLSDWSSFLAKTRLSNPDFLSGLPLKDFDASSHPHV